MVAVEIRSPPEPSHSMPAPAKSEPLVAHVTRPGGVLYRHFGDIRAGLYGPHALLLQVMHPVVDAGVQQHSRFKREPFQRLFETARSMATIVYGGPDGSAAECRRLRRMHATIRGTRPDGEVYRALDAEAWAWVYATLLKGSLDAQQRFGREFLEERLEAYYREGRELGMLLGVRERDLPDSYEAFERYFDETVRTKLRDTASARDVLAFLRRFPKPPLVPELLWTLGTLPLVWGVWVVTVGTLPPHVRSLLGLRLTSLERALLRWGTLLLQIAFAIIPWPLCYQGTRLLGVLNGRWRLREEARDGIGRAPRVESGSDDEVEHRDEPRLPGGSG